MEKLQEQSAISLTTPLEMSRRILGSSAIVHLQPEGHDISVTLDVESFVRRLLLFDTYVLYSIRLKEIPELVRHFGFEGTLALLSSGAIEIRCECVQFREGQLMTPPCPLLTFQFHVIDAHNRNQYVIDNLSEINQIPRLSPRQLMDLRSAVMRVVTQPDNREMFASKVAPAFEADVLHNGPLLKTAVRLLLARNKGLRDIEDFELKFHKVGEDRYEAETDLPSKLAMSVEDVHDVLKGAVIGVSSVDQRIGEMQVHSAVSGFTAEELPLFRSKLDALVEVTGSQKQEQRFQRLVDVAGLPAISADSQIDIERILEIRNQPEALEFRAWLTDINKLSDREIQQLIDSLNAKLGVKVTTGVGKLFRFLATTAAGLAPDWGLALGVALSALDQFALDKLVRRSGVAAFVHELYPSIFNK